MKISKTKKRMSEKNVEELSQKYECYNQIKKVETGDLSLKNFNAIIRDMAMDKYNDKLETIFNSIKSDKDKSIYIIKYKNYLYNKGVENIDEKIYNLINMVLEFNDFNILTDHCLDVLTVLTEDIKKQNPSEKFKKDYLQYNGYIVKKLSSRGKNAYYLSKNKLVQKDDVNYVHAESTKSIDFLINNNIFVCDKTTNDNGGGQDNQYLDVLEFAKKANKCKGKHRFIALVDGDYYTEDKLNELKEYETKNFKICQMNTIDRVLYKWK